MLIWIVLSVVTRPSLCESNDARYECGAHGRFEYCIDGIPGCVIGCHCHPGYYFDTDSKICEPNIKLTQDYRRHYQSEPTRIDNSQITAFPPQIEPTPTPTDPIDKKVDEITKDADDLGDWLYNQFFKTIENQVINNTKEDKVLTRRSGTFAQKPKRKMRKYRKRSKKKKSGLKRKLLRITEDDSLFDSSSGSTSDEQSDSSSNESEDLSSSAISRPKSHQGHGHKKFIFFNKKPKPPLPSFIFLPNIETPYYPPIGLPPPAVPMYPLVPVPPVGPMFPFPGYPSKNEDDAVCTSTTGTVATTYVTNGSLTNGASTNGATTTTAGTTEIPLNVSKPPPGEKSDDEKSEDKKPDKKSEEEKPDENGNPDDEKILRGKKKHGTRNKFLQKLRDKMKKRKSKMPALNNFVDQFQDAEAPFDIDIPQDPFAYPVSSENEPKSLGEVDFKYLTQLIHRMDNNTNFPTTNEIRQPKMIPPLNQMYRRDYHNVDISNVKPVQNNLRTYAPRTNNLDDTYYSNLGRQIASLIRKIDNNGEREVNIEIEKTNKPILSPPVFNENSNAARSYWERYVRSPLKHFFPYTDEFDFLKKSNEHLYDLENKVKLATVTEPSLNLKELEDIISTMEKAKSQLNYKVRATPSNISLNVNLLPKHIHSYRRNFKEPQRITNSKNIQLKPNSGNTILQSDNFVKPTPWMNLQKNKTKDILTVYKIKSIEIDNNKKIESKFVPPNKPARINQQMTNVNMFFLTTKKPILKYMLNPMILNHKTVKNLPNKQYILKERSFPLNMAPFPRRITNFFGKTIKPSYFHHDINNFDYFD